MHAHRARPARRDARTDRRFARPARVPGRPLSGSDEPSVTAQPSDDRRRIASALASAFLPGLGQLGSGRYKLARYLLLPAVGLAVFSGLMLAMNSPARLFASMISPTAMRALLVLNGVVLAWRSVAVLQAFFDRRYARRPGRLGAIGLVVLALAVVTPHAIANSWGTSAETAFASVFTRGKDEGRGATVPGPATTDRINILVIGIDKTPWRTATLTDSLMVLSIDPVGGTTTMVSLPRDLVRVPLGNGDVFGPKINSLMSYADTHAATFPLGGIRTLENAIGALLGITIHYYAKVDFFGFVKIVDAVGGIDIDVKKAFNDPKYDGLGVNPTGVYGWSVTVGLHHFNGWEALAYARSRYADGESDFSRAARQQEVILGLRTKVLTAGNLLTQLPSLLSSLGDLVTTDLPTDRLPDLAAIANDMRPGAIYRTVLKNPLIKTGGIDPVYGSIQIPDVPAIQAVARGLFPPPGQIPTPWPTPIPTATAKPGPSASQSSAP